MRAALANVLNCGSVPESGRGGGTTAGKAIELWGTHRPDVTLLDISMAGMDGIETLQALLGKYPLARVLMLTSSKAPERHA